MRDSPGTRRALGLLLFLLTVSVSAYSVLTHRQLSILAGMADEWYHLGANLSVYGTLGLVHDPVVLRPPGYPAFVATLLRLGMDVPPELTWEYMARGAHLVYLAQCVVLALTSVLLFLWLADLAPPLLAFAGGLLFGANPYLLALTGFLHYSVLHLFVLVAAGYATHVGLRRRPASALVLLLSGSAFGLAALVRPVTLLLPAFLPLALRARGLSWGAAIRGAALFAAGMALPILPWTARNYAVTGRLIPINAQTWGALWGSTVKPLGVHPNHYAWYELVDDHVVPLFRTVTGERDYNYQVFARHNLAMEAAFRREALRNLRRQPWVYAGNVVRSLVTLNLHINSVLVTVFEHIQRPGTAMTQEWFYVGHPQDFHPAGSAAAWTGLVYILTALAVAGVVVAIRERQAALAWPGAVYVAICVLHAFTYMDWLYYYVKLPFLVLFAFVLLARLEAIRLPLPGLGRRVPVGSAAAVALLAWGVGLTLHVL